MFVTLSLVFILSRHLFGGSLTRHTSVRQYSRAPGLSTLHSCHNYNVPSRGKDVHGLMVIRRHVPF